MSEQQSILITGAGGLIGSALCETFLSAGWKVFG
ncbi:MAG: NAD-dependent epimerase/dehydratase family protein, partial [Actinobacteria bacterium]|nr:NAD-dependent epimerase/dehydratase family protein [Actinomycetota bacterium]